MPLFHTCFGYFVPAFVPVAAWNLHGYWACNGLLIQRFENGTLWGDNRGRFELKSFTDFLCVFEGQTQRLSLTLLQRLTTCKTQWTTQRQTQRQTLQVITTRSLCRHLCFFIIAAPTMSTARILSVWGHGFVLTLHISFTRETLRALFIVLVSTARVT